MNISPGPNLVSRARVPWMGVRPFQILLGNFLATFRILSNFFVREQLLATFRKTSTFLVTFGQFWTKMLNNPPAPLFLNKQVKILNIFLVKLIFLPFERVSCGHGNNYKNWVWVWVASTLFPGLFPSREGENARKQKLAIVDLYTRLLHLLSNFL